jgi:ligand-binding sensor domain-containing protein
MSNAHLFRHALTLFLGLCFVHANAQTISWSKVDGPYAGVIQLLAVDSSGNVFASTFEGMYRSTDNGSSWQTLGFSLEFGASFLVIDSTNNIYTGNRSEGLYASTNQGISWFKTSLTGSPYSAAVISGNRICIGGVQTVSISNDGGKTWSSSQVTTDPTEVLSIAEDDSGNIYAGLEAFFPRNDPAYGGGIYISSDSGRTWKFHGMLLTSIISIAVNRAGKIFSIAMDSAGNKFLRTDAATYGLANPLTLLQDHEGEIVAVTDNGLFVYSDSTDDWKEVAPNISSAAITTAFYNPNGITYAGTERDGVYFLEKSSAMWSQCGIYSASLTSLGMDRLGMLYAGTGSGIYRQESTGRGWRRVSDGLGRETVYQIQPSMFDPTQLYAATSGGLFYLPENGSYWIALTKQWVYNFEESSIGNAYAGSTSGILTAHVGDDLWTPLQTIGLPFTKIYCLALDSSNNFFAGTRNDGVFESTNGGTFWMQTGINSPLIFCSVNTIQIDNKGKMFVGTDSAGAYYSDDAGINWRKISTITGKNVTGFLLSHASEYFVGTLDCGVFVSTDRGESWQSTNNGLTDSSVTSLMYDQQGYLYAATDSGLFRSRSITAVVHQTNGQPASFSLAQNYPNPFNPSTSIQYSVSGSQKVTLKVYDVLGREVATLVNERKLPGMYTVQFVGSKYASGVYFYRLAAGDYVETKKMVLTK